MNREALAKLMQGHRFVADNRNGEPGCSCGAEFLGGFDYRAYGEHAADAVLMLQAGELR